MVQRSTIASSLEVNDEEDGDGSVLLVGVLESVPADVVNVDGGAVDGDYE